MTAGQRTRQERYNAMHMFTRFTLTLVAGAWLLGVLPGCAQTVWTHPTKGIREFYADSAQCEAIAGQAGGFYDPYGITKARVYPKCLYGAGWTPAR